MTSSTVNCRQIPGQLDPYGDIAGLGVILGFVISAWLTILILVAYYIFAFDPHADPFPCTNNQNRSTNTHVPNPLDVLVAQYTKYLRLGKNFSGGHGDNVFHKVGSYDRPVPIFTPAHMLETHS
ncbi:hypothetical protein CSPAE12_07335 [Colletotrichum incanum]|nr:hypothetical protein CSPAE12_07335 [Colletotrichum incanum]